VETPAGSAGRCPARSTVELEFAAAPLAPPPRTARIGIDPGRAISDGVPQATEPEQRSEPPLDLINASSRCRPAMDLPTVVGQRSLYRLKCLIALNNRTRVACLIADATLLSSLLGVALPRRLADTGHAQPGFRS
jgi:hypothetical protein